MQEINSQGITIRTTDIILISGKRGTGKTFFMKWYIVENLLKKIKVFIWDPLWQYGELGRVVHDLSDIDREDIKNKNYAIVFQPDPEQDNEDFFDSVALWVFRQKEMIFVGEEINEYMTPYKITPHFRALIRRGRNFGIGVIAVTHRPAYMSLNFLNQIDHWFIFHQDLKADLDRLYEYMERANPDIDQDFIAGLPDWHYIHYFRERKSGKAQAIPCNPINPKKKIETEPTE